MAFDYNTWKRQYLAHERHRQANSGAPAPMATGRAGGYRPGPSGGATSKGGVVDLTADDDDDVQATGPFSQSALGKRPYEQHQSSSYDHWSRSTFSGGLGFVRPRARARAPCGPSHVLVDTVRAMRDAQGAYASINFAVYDESHFKIEPEGIRLPDQVTELMRSSFPRARQHKESFYVPLRYHDKVRDGTARAAPTTPRPRY